MDLINHPHYYNDGEIECIKLMEYMFGREAVKGFCRCNSLKYRMRAGKKEGESGAKDILKAEWYENYLAGMIEEEGI